MCREILDRAICDRGFAERRQEIADPGLELQIAVFDLLCSHQSRHKRLRQTRKVVNSIQSCLDLLRLDDRIPKRVVKFDLTFLRDQINRRWKVSGVDPCLKEI